MSRLKKFALEKDYLDEPIEIQLDMIIFPYLDKVAQARATEINFPFSAAVVDEIYASIQSNYSLNVNSTLKEIQDAVQYSSAKWQEDMKNSQSQQNVASKGTK